MLSKGRSSNVELFPGLLLSWDWAVGVGALQLGNPAKAQARQHATRSNSSFVGTTVRVDVNLIEKGLRGKLANLFKNGRQGFFEFEKERYYQFTNIIAAISKPWLAYKGRLPNAWLTISVHKSDGQRTCVIEVTRPFLIESRLPFTRKPTFEQMLTDVILAIQVLERRIPIHAAAITTGERGILFLGYPESGKTTLARTLSARLCAPLVAEDILFWDEAHNRLVGCPFTESMGRVEPSGVVQPVTQELKGVEVFWLGRDRGEVRVDRLKSEETWRYLVSSTQFEFSYRSSSVACLLFGPWHDEENIGGVSNAHDVALRKLAMTARGWRLGGDRRDLWPELVETTLAGARWTP
jgi:hypothetical protein